MKPDGERIGRFAEMFAALGTGPRLRIVRLLLSAHPEGMVVSDIQAHLKIAPSTLSHHLEKLRHQHLVKVRRDRQFLWYSADSQALRELLAFLYEECCSRGGAVTVESIVEACRK